MSDDEVTRIIRREKSVAEPKPEAPGPTPQPLPFEGEPVTRMYRPNRPEVASTKVESPSQKKEAPTEIEPVVGWLVVIDGPGKGASLTLGYGVNSVGRSESERVVMNFGDPEISRERHVLLTYDHKNGKFFLQSGGGPNLTYVGDVPVLQPVELEGREIISLGMTKVCFVPFCGQDFQW